MTDKDVSPRDRGSAGPAVVNFPPHPVDGSTGFEGGDRRPPTPRLPRQETVERQSLLMLIGVIVAVLVLVPLLVWWIWDDGAVPGAVLTREGVSGQAPISDAISPAVQGLASGDTSDAP